MMRVTALHFKAPSETGKTLVVVIKMLMLCEDFTNSVFLFCLQLQSEKAAENYLALLKFPWLSLWCQRHEPGSGENPT